MTDSEFAARQQAITDVLPTEFRGPLEFYAWQHSHASGYDDILITLGEAVDAIKEPLAKYTVRIQAASSRPKAGGSITDGAGSFYNTEFRAIPRTVEISRQKARSLTNEGGWSAIKSGQKVVCLVGDVRSIVWAEIHKDKNLRTRYFMGTP